jgi:tetratricopeptide (TPR) repeat protein
MVARLEESLFGDESVRDSRDLIDLLAFAHEEERRFAADLSEDEQALAGTLEDPAPKDVLAHLAGAKDGMRRALETRRRGGEPDASHDRAALFAANRGRSFAAVQDALARATDDLIAEVARLRGPDVHSSPAWIDAPTLGEEIVTYGVNHSLVHLFEPLSTRGDAAECIRIQEDFVVALPADATARLRGGALFNLACLYCRAERADDARQVLDEALQLAPELADQVVTDPDLEPLRGCRS